LNSITASPPAFEKLFRELRPEPIDANISRRERLLDAFVGA
jgi:hypothetical protein